MHRAVRDVHQVHVVETLGVVGEVLDEAVATVLLAALDQEFHVRGRYDPRSFERVHREDVRQ
jgi:hypothetical protein